jgi:Prenyltransferase and squalene oxidase repeat
MARLIRILGLAAAALAVSVSSAAGAGPARRDAVDNAVDRALQFLQRTQDADGGWQAGRSGKNPAITALSVMAFLSTGHVPGEGPYGETVEKGVRWVLRAQHPNGLIATEGAHEMYHHGICTLMLAEVAGMTDARLAGEVRRKLEKAVEVILRAQRTTGVHQGGWRYRMAGYDSDISVTGWQLLALRAAKNLGCDVPPESIERAVEYIKRCQDPATGGFRYFPGSHMTIPCTGTSILGLEICGKAQHRSPEALRAGAFLLKNPPRWGQEHFFYSVYYCSQATFQLGDNYWSYFRPKLHEALLPHQSPNGSWLGADGEGRTYGPNYCTAMAILSLTVEYRYLPIYQRGEEPAEKPDK